MGLEYFNHLHYFSQHPLLLQSFWYEMINKIQFEDAHIFLAPFGARRNIHFIGFLVILFLFFCFPTSFGHGRGNCYCS
jgi:hypothetical protein